MKELSELQRKELEALASKSEAEIDLSDIPELPAQAWKSAAVGKFYRPLKKQLTIRLDADVLEWLRSQGRGYQTKLNSILRNAMEQDANHQNPR
jgi:uncharacterized protein (DUF4415 family)